MRVVSLLASGTELVCALGAGEMLVGRSHECDTPEWVKRLPAVSRPTFDVTGSSAEIDGFVRAKLAAGEPLYEVDEKLLVELAPDVLITQTHCEVCAVTPGDVARGVPSALCRQQVVALRAGTLEGILAGFVEVARVLGREARGADFALACRDRVESVRKRTRGLRRPRVACLEWTDPIFAMGNWGPELVEAAGGESLLATPGGHSTTTPWEAVVSADPDVLVVAPCGYAMDRTLREMPALASREGWNRLAAVRSGRVYVADGNRYFNRSGPSAFETAEVLAEMLHPETFEPLHRSQCWVPYPGHC
ncbi:MAG TPA: cobalamin-binding protein [Polyangiaceae bacterium]